MRDDDLLILAALGAGAVGTAALAASVRAAAPAASDFLFQLRRLTKCDDGEGEQDRKLCDFALHGNLLCR